MYLLLGLYFGHSALERLVPRVSKQEKTAALFEELNISRESVLLGKVDVLRMFIWHCIIHSYAPKSIRILMSAGLTAFALR